MIIILRVFIRFITDLSYRCIENPYPFSVVIQICNYIRSKTLSRMRLYRLIIAGRIINDLAVVDICGHLRNGYSLLDIVGRQRYTAHADFERFGIRVYGQVYRAGL